MPLHLFQLSGLNMDKNTQGKAQIHFWLIVGQCFGLWGQIAVEEREFGPEVDPL